LQTLSPDAPDPSATRPVFELPPEYASEAEFLAEMREDFYDDYHFDKLNRDAAIEDLEFAVGNQWDPTMRQRRVDAFKPVLTINRILAFLAQVVGSRKQSETVVKISPENGGTRSVARVRENLLRSIQKTSRCEHVYDNALMGAVSCGIGNFEVELADSDNDIWVKEIRFSPILDHLSVVWDRARTEPTGKDARRVFKTDIISHKDFKRMWPWAVPSDVDVNFTSSYASRLSGWYTQNDVRIVDYWRMRTRERQYALLNTGATVDITDLGDSPEDRQMLSQIVMDKNNAPYIRKVTEKFAQLYVCSGSDILAGPYNLPVDRVPILRVPGWEMRVGDQVHRWGLVRFLKDPQRLHNYWRSVVAEKMMQTPRGVWTAADTAVEGREAQWRNSHLTDDPLLVWNAESGQKPERIPPASFEQALLGQAEITNQDLKDVSNIHEANLGMPSNEVSGAAIQARQRVSDTGTIVYHDNLNDAIEEGGRIANDLIRVVYDTPRIVKVLGEDAQQDMQVINTADHPESIDITLGKYSVSVVTGASTATKRMEAAQAMMSLATAMPQVLGSAADLIVAAMDWPGADKIAERLRLQMPPGTLGPDEMTPAIAARQQSQAQQQGVQAQAAMAAAQVKIQSMASQTTLNLARARNYMVQADAQGPALQQSAAQAASQISDRELRGRLEAVRVATGQ
jgi:hypothetical protein